MGNFSSSAVAAAFFGETSFAEFASAAFRSAAFVSVFFVSVAFTSDDLSASFWAARAPTIVRTSSNAAAPIGSMKLRAPYSISGHDKKLPGATMRIDGGLFRRAGNNLVLRATLDGRAN